MIDTHRCQADGSSHYLAPYEDASKIYFLKRITDEDKNYPDGLVKIMQARVIFNIRVIAPTMGQTKISYLFQCRNHGICN